MNKTVHVLNILINDNKTGIIQKTLLFENSDKADKEYENIINDFIESNEETFDWKSCDDTETEIKCFRKRMIINKKESIII